MSAFRLSRKRTGVFRITAWNGTPLLKFARKSPLELRNCTYRPHVSWKPTFTLCAPVTYDAENEAAKRSGYMPCCVAPAFQDVPSAVSALLTVVYHSALKGAFSMPGWYSVLERS